MVLLSYIISIFIIKYNWKINIETSIIYGFILFFCLSFLLILIENFIGFSGFLIPCLLTIFTIFFLSKYILIEGNLTFNTPKNKFFYIFLGILFLLVIFGIYGIDNSYDGKSYHIDIIYSLFGGENILKTENFTHFWAISYPKFGEYIIGSFSQIFNFLSISSYFLGNILVIFIFYIVSYKLGDTLGLKYEKTKSILAFLICLNPIILGQAITGLIDNIFLLFISFGLYFLFSTYSKVNIISFVLVIIGLINIKYSGPFLGFIICIFYLTLHFNNIKLKHYFVILLFFPAFIFYIKHYLNFGTPLYPFYSLADLKTFFLNLPHGPKGRNDGVMRKEIIYGNFIAPNGLFIIKLFNLGEFNLNKIFQLAYGNYFVYGNSFGVMWIFIFLSIPFFMFKIIKEKNKKLIILTTLILILYFIQSTKWEVRYFGYFMWFGYFGIFYIFENLNKNLKLQKIFINLSLFCVIFYVFFALYGQYDVGKVYGEFFKIMKEDKKIYQVQNSDFLYLYYYGKESLKKDIKIESFEDIIKNNLHDSIILSTTKRNGEFGEKIKNLGYDYKFKDSFGFIIK